MTSVLLGDLHFVENQLRTLTWSREVYGQLLASNRLNEEERHWLWYNHLQAAVLAVRRLLDRDPRSVSLASVLARLNEAPEFRGSQQLRSDLQRLAELRTATESFANKYVAHADRSGPVGRAPGFEVIDEWDQTLRSIFLRWRTLLTDNTSVELGPEVQWGAGAS